MLRLPKFEVAAPQTVDEALALLAEYGADAMLMAGGTDLVPNMKHGLFEPKLVVSVSAIDELQGVAIEDDGTLVIGAATTLQAVATNDEVRRRAPAFAQAAGLVAGPQLRRMGTVGGNVMLDTRCQWYNQTHFWRKSLGFCLKKDGSLCHVVEGGSKCVAAASNDTAPTLMSLGAKLVFARRNSEGQVVRKTLAVDDLYKSDGAFNKKVAGDELLIAVRIPAGAPQHRGAYGKLRDRGSIDFPLLGVAVRIDLDDAGAVADADLVAVALQARPIRLKKAAEALVGNTPGKPGWDEAVDAAAEAAYGQCHPMPNIPGDHDYRREMVPVYVRRTIRAAVAGEGPVHHV
ncbi:FAD binding domain-containing protein [Engelhardtia mirabilis]|uniref:4-hydroxybenzoyl-CoA reductase subunit beta n=1 Tax=Engelhardtia mirabilis TaxID=2528011 RepID=A0A518BNJ4_9BACT|nr:4-hydroxybenzoyl-CoA reductase subunit beta [Planctomycetes bacterium Pla133]QDV02877.1 4-hydroxybenzoyl-CoA reductase subunit beta [Planctomycetes bacterium Pla86]